MNKTKILNDNVEIFVKREIKKTEDECIINPIVRDFNALLDLMQDLGNRVILVKDSEFKSKFGDQGVLIINDTTNNQIYLGRIISSFDGNCVREMHSCFMKFKKPETDNDSIIEYFDYEQRTMTIYIDPSSRINDCTLLLEHFLNSGDFPEIDSCINYVKV